MALNNKDSLLVLIDDLVEDVVKSQPLTVRKSNTVSAAIGGIITVLLSGASYLTESQTNLPGWFPTVVGILGIFATVFKVSQTKNGVTSSVANVLKNELTNRIDLNHLHEINTAPPLVVYSSTAHSQQDPASMRDEAYNLREAAERIINNFNK